MASPEDLCLELVKDMNVLALGELGRGQDDVVTQLPRAALLQCRPTGVEARRLGCQEKTSDSALLKREGAGV